MRSPIRSTFCTALLVLLGSSALAQPATPAAAPNQPRPTPPAVAPGEGVLSTQTASGRLQQWLVNPNGDVDGMLLTDGTQLAFPPHWSTRVQAAFKAGDTVRATGWRAAQAPVLQVTALVTAKGQRLEDQPPADGGPPAPREPAALTAMSASGKVVRLLYTGRGDANGVLLDDGGIVRFPPHVGAAMAPRLQPGSTVYARGWGSRGTGGSALEATAIGSSANDMQALFAAPGIAPPGARNPNGPPAGPAGRRPGGPLDPGAASTPTMPPGAVPVPPPPAPAPV